MASCNGGPAFPRAASPADFIDSAQEGTSLRDYFAIHATDKDIENLGGFTCNDAAQYLGIPIYRYDEHYHLLRAKARYQFADAMIAEREKHLASTPSS